MNINSFVSADSLRVTILSPMSIHVLDPWIPGLSNDHSVPAGMGGYSVSNLVRTRLEQGMPTDVITCSPDIDQPLLFRQGARVRLWVVQRRKRGILRDCLARERHLLGQALVQAEPDVCHANWTYEYAAAALCYAPDRTLITVRDHPEHVLFWLGWKFLPMYFLSRRVIHNGRHFTAVSPYIAQYIARRTKRRVPVVANPATAGASLSTTSDLPAPVITTVANDSRLKNVRSAVRAFRDVRKVFSTATLQLVGPGLQPGGALSTWVHANQLADGVVFCGPFPHEECTGKIAASSVYFHPSLEESFGNPVAEAMASGVPVVGCRQARGVAWLLDNGAVGRLTDGRSCPKMTAALVETLQGGERVARRVHYARQRAVELCRPKTIVQNYDECYRQISRA